MIDEISSLSMKVFGSLMNLSSEEKIAELEPLVFTTGSVVQRELSSFKRLFKSYREMISSTEK